MNYTNIAYGEKSSDVDYWSNCRSRVADLYPSERYFFDEVILKSKSVLDVGCAAGGSYLFTKEANSSVTYKGIDTAPSLVNAAQDKFGHQYFDIFDGKSIPCEDNSYDLVFCFGVVHHIPDWLSYVKELFRVSKKYVLFDVRCDYFKSINNIKDSYQKMAFGGDWDGSSQVPYCVISLGEYIDKLKTSFSSSSSISCYGYSGKPTELAVTSFGEVIFISTLIEKGNDNIPFKLELK